MAQPLVIAYHLIWTAYGWWLPNDPRGSGSHRVASDVLKSLGELHHGRKQIQPPGTVVREFYDEARVLLQFPVQAFDASDRDIIAAAFAEVVAYQRYTCYACTIMPDHVHLVIRKHKHSIEDIAENLQRESRLRLSTTAPRWAHHPVWTRGAGWKVFLDHPDEIRRTIRYVENNPLPLRLPIQRWDFVAPYDGWPLHAGHSPNSPYARALRAAGRYP